MARDLVVFQVHEGALKIIRSRNDGGLCSPLPIDSSWAALRVPVLAHDTPVTCSSCQLPASPSSGGPSKLRNREADGLDAWVH